MHVCVCVCVCDSEGNVTAIHLKNEKKTARIKENTRVISFQGRYKVIVEKPSLLTK